MVLVGHGGCHQGLTSSSWLCLGPEGGWQGHGCGRWQWGQGWGGWWPWDRVLVPSGDTEVARASVSAGEHPTLSPGFPSPPCAALWLWLPMPGPLGLGEEGRGVLGSPWAELETHFHFYCHLTSLCSSELCV